MISSPRDGDTADATTSAIAIATSTCPGPVYMTIQQVCTLSETGENWRHDVTVACLGRRGVYRVRTDEGCCSAAARSFCRQTWSAATAPPPIIINPFAITPLGPRRHNEVISETSDSRRNSTAAATDDDNNDNNSENTVCEHIIFYKYNIYYYMSLWPTHVALTVFRFFGTFCWLHFIYFTYYIRRTLGLYISRGCILSDVSRRVVSDATANPIPNVVYGHNAFPIYS